MFAFLGDLPGRLRYCAFYTVAAASTSPRLNPSVDSGTNNNNNNERLRPLCLLHFVVVVVVVVVLSFLFLFQRSSFGRVASEHLSGSLAH